jgi:hypothetical protein
LTTSVPGALLELPLEDAELDASELDDEEEEDDPQAASAAAAISARSSARYRRARLE